MDVERSFSTEPYCPPGSTKSPGVVRDGPYTFSPVPHIPPPGFAIPDTSVHARHTAQPPQQLGGEIEALITELGQVANYLVSCKNAVRDQEDVRLLLQRSQPLEALIPNLGALIQAYSLQLATGQPAAVAPDWKGEGKIGAESDLCRLQHAVEALNRDIIKPDIQPQEINRLLQKVSDDWQTFHDSSTKLLNGVNEACFQSSQPVDYQNVSTAVERLPSRSELERERTDSRIRAEGKFIKAILSVSKLANCVGKGLGWLCDGAFRLGCYGVDRLEALVNLAFEPFVGKREVKKDREAGRIASNEAPQATHGGVRHREPHSEVHGFKPLQGNRRTLASLPRSKVEEELPPKPVTPHWLPSSEPEPGGESELPARPFVPVSPPDPSASRPAGRRQTFNRPKGPLSRYCATAQKASIGIPKAAPVLAPLAGNRQQLLLGKITSLFEQPRPDIEAFLLKEFDDLEALHTFQLFHLPGLVTQLKPADYEQFSQVFLVHKDRLLNVAAHTAIITSDSFENLFAGKIKPDEFDPLEKIDLERYVSRIQQKLREEAERTQTALTEARKRFRISEGKDLHAQLLMRKLEIRSDEIIRNTSEEQIRQSLLFYAGNQLDAQSTAVQADAIAERLMRLQGSMAADQDLKPTDREISFLSSRLKHLRRHLHWLEQGGCIEHDDDAYTSLGRAQETCVKAEARMWEVYEEVVYVDPVACLGRVEQLLMNQEQILVKAGMESSEEFASVQTVLRLIRSSSGSRSWSQIYAAVEDAGPWMKKLIYREFGTLKVQALEHAADYSRFLSKNYSSLCCLTDDEIMNTLARLLTGWQQHNPSFYGYLIQHYPQFKLEDLPGLAMGRFRDTMRTTVGICQQEAALGRQIYKKPDSCLEALIASVIQNGSRAGKPFRKNLEACPDEYQVALVRLHLNKFCQQLSSTGQPRYPLLVQMQESDLQWVEHLSFDSLYQQALTVTGQASLSEQEHRQLMALFIQLRADACHRNEDSMVYLIADLYSDS